MFCSQVGGNNDKDENGHESWDASRPPRGYISVPADNFSLFSGCQYLSQKLDVVYRHADYVSKEYPILKREGVIVLKHIFLMVQSNIWREEIAEKEFQLKLREILGEKYPEMPYDDQEEISRYLPVQCGDSPKESRMCTRIGRTGTNLMEKTDIYIYHYVRMRYTPYAILSDWPKGLRTKKKLHWQ
jgi:hypothetical protein